MSCKHHELRKYTLMKLIADSGSTKTAWAVVDDVKKVVITCKTQGINPFHQNDSQILHVLEQELLPQLDKPVDEVYFYGSGVTERMTARMNEVLLHAFPHACVQSANDLLGAARALFGHQPGIACILGTGSNSCFYDGEHIAMNIPPLGYVLGDEGSGTHIGKAFLNGIFKGELSTALRDKYLAWSGLSYADIINKVYREPLANRFLASVVPFVKEQMDANDKDAIALVTLVDDCFRQFYDNNVARYEHLVCKGDMSPRYGIGFVGGVACAFSDRLRKLCQEEHRYLRFKCIQTPLEGLTAYHM